MVKTIDESLTTMRGIDTPHNLPQMYYHHNIAGKVKSVIIFIF